MWFVRGLLLCKHFLVLVMYNLILFHIIKSWDRQRCEINFQHESWKNISGKHLNEMIFQILFTLFCSFSIWKEISFWTNTLIFIGYLYLRMLYYFLLSMQVSMSERGGIFGIRHGLRTPNEGINQRYLKNWADMADKICFGYT